MIKRTIHIEIEFDDTDTDSDDLYADTANAVWMLLKAIAESGRFDFSIDHDGKRTDADVGDNLNARWDEYGKEARWG